MAEAGPSTSAAPASSSETTPAQPNPRYENFNNALTYVDETGNDKPSVLGLIDQKVNPQTVKTILPALNPKVETITAAFTEELKRRILESCYIIADNCNLSDRLSELEALVREADVRAEKGVKPDSEQGKDAWRPGMDIDTAVYARAAAAQREQISTLEQELAELEASNAKAHAAMRTAAGQASGRQALAREALDAIEEAIAGLATDDETQARIRSVMDSLLAELGPRTEMS